jgi:Asp-tRNA(Asn)/Glu-tRNA(Gln) amidotransferase C subunit
LEQIDEKSTTAERLQNRLAQWTMRQLKKLSAIDKKHLEVDSPSNLKAITDIFTKYASILEKEATVEVVSDLLSGRDDDTLSNKENERIMRVLPKKSRKNSIGEDIFDVDEEETNPQSNGKSGIIQLRSRN